MLGGASAPEPVPEMAEAPVTARPSLDLNFVAEAVQGGRWSEWGERFSNLADLAARVEYHLRPGQRVRRLAIAAYSAEHTSGFVSFDIGFGNKERVDGLNMNPIRPEVAAKLAALKPLLETGGVFELRVAGMGQGEHGVRALQAVADTLGVAARGPVDKSAGLAPWAGLVLEWMTVFPSAWRLPPIRTNWLETWSDGFRTVDPAFVPIPGAPARALPGLAPPGPGEFHYASRPAAAWLPGLPAVSGIGDAVDLTLAALGPGELVKRFAITTHTPAPYQGYVSFDGADAESIDGSIREQPGYDHLQVIVPSVRAAFERLRPRLAPDAVIECHSAGFGLGESGRRAMRIMADLLGVEVRVAMCSTADLRASGGLVTRWRTVYPSAKGLEPVESAWREISQPAVHGAWVPVEAWSFAPIRGLAAPLPECAQAPAAIEATPEAPAESAATELLVVCAGCGRVLDETPSTPMRARTPCGTCGSVARRQEAPPAHRQRPRLLGRRRGRR